MHGDGIGGGYLFCDGDNRADDGAGKPRPPILYTIQQITAAEPIAYVMVIAAPVVPLAIGWHARYEALVAQLGTLLNCA